MEWQFGAEHPKPIRTLLEQVFESSYTEIPDGSIFVPKESYSNRQITLETPAYISESTLRDAGDWTYYLELSVIKELLEGFNGIDQDLLQRITHYAIFDDFPPS